MIGTEKQLKPTPDGKGYLRVKLSQKPEEKGKYRTKDYRLHRLVAKYFCENFTEEKEVHHKNLRRWDNRASNLVCLTKAEHAELHRKLREKQQEEKNGGSSKAA